jgi:hypothetical protein
MTRGVDDLLADLAEAADAAAELVSLGVTLRDDVPRLDKAIKRWRQTQA